MIKSRHNALREEFVRLYCVFEQDGQLADPTEQPIVNIVQNEHYSESSSSSSESPSSASSVTIESSSSRTEVSSSSTEHVSGEAAGYGWFYAQKENTGIWYVDWFVPEDAELGFYYDIWTWRWSADADVQNLTLRITVGAADEFLNFQSNNLALKMSNKGVDMIKALKTNLVYDVANIPIYDELAHVISDTELSFGFGNWVDTFKPILRNSIRNIGTGWTNDMNGRISLSTAMDPEDQFYASYHFSYFSDQEYFSFLNEGLYAMNAVPPATEAYSRIASMPFVWRYPVALYGAIQALRRLIMATTMQEKQLIWGEAPQRAAEAYERYNGLLSEYLEIWKEVKSDAKSKKLPGMAIYVQPEYTLPGGRSRWFRYLYKN